MIDKVAVGAPAGKGIVAFPFLTVGAEAEGRAWGHSLTKNPSPPGHF